MPGSPQPQFVYLARIVETDVYKLGVSCNPSRRISEFGPPCTVFHYVETADVWTVETRLLKKFGNYNIGGEWLQCPGGAVSRIVAEMEYERKRCGQKQGEYQGDIFRSYSVRCAMPECSEMLEILPPDVGGAVTKKKAISGLRERGWSNRDGLGWTCGGHSGYERRKAKQSVELGPGDVHGLG